MSPRFAAILVICALCGWSQSRTPAGPASPDLNLGLKIPPNSGFRLPPTTEAKLANGMRVLLSADSSAGLVSGALLIPAGHLMDPPDKLGLAATAAQSLVMGGTRKRSREKLQQQLGEWGAVLEGRTYEEHLEISFHCLSEYQEPMVELLGELLREPAYELEAIEQAMMGLRNRVAFQYRTTELTVAQAMEEALQAGGGKARRRMEYGHLDSIHREDLFRFHERFVHPQGVLLALQGELEIQRTQEILQRLLGDWKPGGEFRPAEVFQGKPVAGVLVVPTPDDGAARFRIALSAPGFIRNIYPAALLASSVLREYLNRAMSQDPASSLMNLSAQLYLHPRMSVPSSIQIVGSVRTTSVTNALVLLTEAIKKFKLSEVPENILESSRRIAADGLPPQISIEGGMFRHAARLYFHGLKLDSVSDWSRRLNAMTRTDLEAGLKQIGMANPAIVVAGDESAFYPPLANLGMAIHRFDSSIPPPSPLEPKTDAESLALGKQWMERMQAALGGRQKLAAIQDYTCKFEGIRTTGSGFVKITYTDRWLAPETFRQDQVISGQEVSVFYDGKIAWLAQPARSMALPPSMLEQIRGEQFRLLFRLALSDQTEGRTVSYIGSGILHIAGSGGSWVRLAVDENTHLPKRFTYRLTEGQRVPITMEESLEDWREVDGVKMPGRIVTRQNRLVFSDFHVVELLLNSGLPSKELERRP